MASEKDPTKNKGKNKEQTPATLAPLAWMKKKFQNIFIPNANWKKYADPTKQEAFKTELNKEFQGGVTFKDLEYDKKNQQFTIKFTDEKGQQKSLTLKDKNTIELTDTSDASLRAAAKTAKAAGATQMDISQLKGENKEETKLIKQRAYTIAKEEGLEIKGYSPPKNENDVALSNSSPAPKL